MKKCIIILILLFILTMNGCNDKQLDTSIYTSEKPYVTENAELSDEQSLINANSYGFIYGIRNLTGPEDRPDCLGARVKKINSQHYYWEDGKEKNYYTITSLEILEIISGTEKHSETYSVGDTIRVLEYYSFDPNGVFCHDSYNVYYDMNGDMIPISKKLPFSPYWDYDIYQAPFIQTGTEYIITLSDDFLIESELQYVQFYGNNSKFPHEHMNGIYCYKVQLVELSEEAYIYAKSQLPGYDDPDSGIDWSEKNRYFQEVIYLWEKYGDRAEQ